MAQTLAPLAIQTLGRFAVSRGGEPIPDKAWGTHRARTLLKVLLTEYGRPVLRERLMDALWPEATPQAASRNLYTSVSELRRVLEPGLDKPAESAFILSIEAAYQFDSTSPHTLDKQLFAQHLAAGHALSAQGQAEAAVQAFAQAKALYAGDYMPDDLYAAWSTLERERLRNDFIAMLLEAGQLQARLGRYRAAIASCRRVLDLDNCLEEAYRALMLYLYAAGDRAQALSVCAECEATLRRELDVEPLPATHQLADQIRAQRVPEVDQQHAYPTAAPIELPYSIGALPLIGREADQAQLRTAIAHGGLIAVGGEGGLGKSQLIRATLPDAIVSSTHELTQSLAYHPVLEVLRLSGLPTPPIDSAGRDKSHWFAALDEVFASIRRPVVIEDAQWADDGTLEWLAFVGPRLIDRGQVIVITHRPTPRLAALLMRAPWLTRLELGALAEAATVALIQSLAPQQVAVTLLARRLHQLSGGNPLFTLN